MKLAIAFSASLLCLLGGCSTGNMGSGSVFHTASGERFTAITAPVFTDGHYQFVDATGQQQSLYLSQVTSVSAR